MELVDSRRLTGPNRLLPGPGAVLEVALADDIAERAVNAWRAHATRLLAAVGWDDAGLAERRFDGGASLAFDAPIDALYAATEVNEAAWAAAGRQMSGEPARDETEELAELRAQIDTERNPALIALLEAADLHGVACLCDDDHVSIGLGEGSQTWAVDVLPKPDTVDWTKIHDIPTAMITGTNGKSTTARMLLAIAAAAGRIPGTSSTDWIRVGDDILDDGDWSGPGGARLVLRDARTQLGILETARGGMLRRGLALERANVSAVLNVAEDHLGEWGIGTIDGLADGKFVLTRVADEVVLNADDPPVASRADQVEVPLTWFSMDPTNPIIQDHLSAGGLAFVLDGEVLVRCEGDERTHLTTVANVPSTFDGAAKHNVANALAAAAIADVLGLETAAIAQGLASFASRPEDNPGRLNRFQYGDLNVLVDFAHNPHGQASMVDMAKSMGANRWLVVIGQAGDREDDAIRKLVRVTWSARPDHIVLKEMKGHLRGRSEGAVANLMEDELENLEVPTSRWSRQPSEIAAVKSALEWAEPGDLLLLMIHESREQTLADLGRLSDAGWLPGVPLESDILA
jgi:cyanophycin synthetase